MKRLFTGSILFMAIIGAGSIFATAVLAQAENIQMPANENTYIVTYDLRGLQCVQDVGTPDHCAVTNQSADEGGYPWTKVKCKSGDIGVTTFAWSLDDNRPMYIFEAPPALISNAKTYTVNVRLGRTCMKSGTTSEGR